MFMSRTMKWARHVARIRAKRNEYRILVVKPERMKPLGSSKFRWVDNIEIDLREIRWGGMGWIYQAQDRDRWRALVNMVMNFHIP
jgi:hypothetical protein